jgi:hypothetical protein
MGRTGPLAIYDFVKIVGCTDISRFQNSFPPLGRRRFSFRGVQLRSILQPRKDGEKT